MNIQYLNQACRIYSVVNWEEPCEFDIDLLTEYVKRFKNKFNSIEIKNIFLEMEKSLKEKNIMSLESEFLKLIIKLGEKKWKKR